MFSFISDFICRWNSRHSSYFTFHIRPSRRNATPDIPSDFNLWIDVNMSIEINHQWQTLWCDDEPSVDGDGSVWFWSWHKSSWNHNKSLLQSIGIPILYAGYHALAPCSIHIPAGYVTNNPYESLKKLRRAEIAKILTEFKLV